MAKKLTEVASRLASKPATSRQTIYIIDFENIPKTDVAALLRKKHVIMVVLAANRTNTVTPETLKTIEANPDRVDVIIGRITRKEFVDKLVTAKIGEYAFRFPDAEIIVLANDKDYADLATHLNDHWERTVPIEHVAPGKSRSRRAKSTPAKARSDEKTSSPRRAKSKSKSAQKGAEKSSAAEAAPRSSTSRRARKPKAEPKAESKAEPKSRSARQTQRDGGKRAEAKSTPDRQARPSPQAESTSRSITNPDAEAVRDLLANLPKRRLPKSESALLNAVRNYRESVGLRSRPSTIIKHLEECGVVDRTGSPVKYTL